MSRSRFYRSFGGGSVSAGLWGANVQPQSFGGGGLTPGPELIVDQGFNTPADWTPGAGISVSGGLAHFATSSGVRNISANPALSIEVGAQYQVKFDIVNYTTGSVHFSVGGTSGTSRSAVGSYTETITAVTTGNAVLFGQAGANTLDVDNFSVKFLS